MAPSEWMRCVRAVRETPAAHDCTPGVNTTSRVVYHPSIAVSLSLRVLSGSYCKQSLWRCGQLGQYVGLGTLGTRLHRNCNAMGQAANISPRFPSTSTPNGILYLLNMHIIPGRQIYVSIENPSLVPSVSSLTTSSYLCKYVRAADNTAHAENLQSNGWWCFSHLYIFRDQNHVT